MSLTLTPGPARGVTADSSSVSFGAGTTKTAKATAGGATAFAALLTIHAAPALSLEEMPGEQVPGEQVPAEEVPAEEGPGEQVPGEEVPAEEVPGKQVPAEQTPVGQTPVEQDPQLPTPPVAPAASSPAPAPSAPVAVSAPALAAPAAATDAAVATAAAVAVAPALGSTQSGPVAAEPTASAPAGAALVTPAVAEVSSAPVAVDTPSARVVPSALVPGATDTETGTATPLSPVAAIPGPAIATNPAANLTLVAVSEPSAAPTPATPLASQLAKPLFSLVGVAAGEHVMTITVSPDNLGPVTVRAHVGADGIRVEMFSPSEAAREALRLIMPDLRRDLAGAGPGGSSLAAQLELSSQSEPGDPKGERQGERQPRTPADARRPGDTAEPLRPAANPWQTGAPTPRTNSASTIDVMA